MFSPEKQMVKDPFYAWAVHSHKLYAILFCNHTRMYWMRYREQKQRAM